MAGLTQVKNISTGARGAYAKGVLVMAEPGEVIEADDFAGEWFAEEGPKRAEKGEKPADLGAKATEAKK